jgi:hypothetical protein
MAGLLAAFNDAVAGNRQIELKVDDAIIESGRAVAKAIDDTIADPEASAADKVKALYLIPHIVSILRELLATPAARKSFGVAANDTKKASRIQNIKDNIKKG